jgi:predicted transcriptional regulator
LSDSELEVLKVLWNEGASTVRRVNEMLHRDGRRWAYTTVLTLLQRLQAKGWVVSDTSGAAHVFRAAAGREQWLNEQLQTLADQACAGESAPLVLALVQKARFSPQELARFRELIDRLDTKEKR